MLTEYHYDHLMRWPRGERAAVFLTFDFQGGEDVKPDKNGILNYEMWSQGEKMSTAVIPSSTATSAARPGDHRASFISSTSLRASARYRSSCRLCW